MAPAILIYALLGSATGLVLSSLEGFTRKNQLVGALLWPAAVFAFMFGFVRSVMGKGGGAS